MALALLAGGGLLAAMPSGWLHPHDAAPTARGPAPVVEAGAVFSTALLHVAFDEAVPETTARAIAAGLGYTVDASKFALPRVVAYEGAATIEARLRRLEARPDVETVVVHDWRAEARAAAEGAAPADGLCLMRTNRTNQVEVVFESGTTSATAVAAVERAGLERATWEPSPQALVLQVGSASDAAPRLEREPGVRWTARTTAHVALAD